MAKRREKYRVLAKGVNRHFGGSQTHRQRNITKLLFTCNYFWHGTCGAIHYRVQGEGSPIAQLAAFRQAPFGPLTKALNQGVAEPRSDSEI